MELPELKPDALSRLIGKTCDIAVLIDAQGVVVDVSLMRQELTVLGCASWLGKPWIDTVTTESRGKVTEVLAAAAQANETQWRHINHAVPGAPDLAIQYTGFALGKPELARDASGVWQASARVTNTGKRGGAEVVQVYLTLPPAADAVGAKQPPRRLVGYQRVELAAGETRVVSVPVNPDASNHPMGVWNEAKHQWVIPEGRYTVWLGRSSSLADLAVAGTIVR